MDLKANELLVGRIAVELGYVTRVQLAECVRLQEGNEDIPIGDILLFQGFLTQDQLTEVIRVQKQRMQQSPPYSRERRTDIIFGKLAVALGFVEAKQVHAALRTQQQIVEQGSFKRLGVILNEQGVLSVDDIEVILDEQRRPRVSCPGCPATFHPALSRRDGRAICPKCGTVVPDGKRSPAEKETGPEGSSRGNRTLFRVGSTGGAVGNATDSTDAPVGDRAPPEPEGPAKNGKTLFRFGSEVDIPALPDEKETAATGPPPIPEDETHPTTPSYDPDSDDAFIGRLLGQYRILRELGHGAMGIVYLAEQEGLGRLVALKVLPETLSRSKNALDRFKREASSAAKLQHPNVVPVYGIGEADGIHYFAMEYIEGATLDEVMERERISPERAAKLLIQAARGLAHGHENGVVHRDVKPGNMMVTPDDRLLIADFGLAAEQDAATITASGEIMGTPAYMSPEQARGERDEIDAVSDQYSLGVTLYEMLTLVRPFEGADIHSIMAQVISKDAIPLRKINAAIPRDLETIALKVMEKDKRRRYESCDVLADDLRRFLDGEPIAAKPIGVLGRAFRKIRKHKLTTMLVMLLVLATAGGAGFWYWDAERRRIETARQVAGLVREGRALLVQGKQRTGSARTPEELDHTLFQDARGKFSQAKGKDATNAGALQGEAYAKAADEARQDKIKAFQAKLQRIRQELESRESSEKAAVIVAAEQVKPPAEVSDAQLDNAASLCIRAIGQWSGNTAARDLQDAIKKIRAGKLEADTAKRSSERLARGTAMATKAGLLREQAISLRASNGEPAEDGGKSKTKYREALRKYSDALDAIEDALFILGTNERAKREHFRVAVEAADCAVEAGELGLADMLFLRRASRFQRKDDKEDANAVAAVRAKHDSAMLERRQYTAKVRDGEVALRRGEFDTAIEAFEQALLVKDEEDVQSKLLEARAGKLFVQGREALKKKNYTLARTKLGEALAAEGVTSKQKADIDTALKNCDKDELDFLAQRVREAMDESRWDDVLADSKRALALERGDRQTLAELSKMRIRAHHLKNLPPDMVYVERLTKIRVGSSDSNDRNPPTEIAILSPFYIARTEITNRRFAEFIKAGGYETEGYWRAEGWKRHANFVTAGADKGKGKVEKKRFGPAFWPGSFPEGQDDYPVSGISWYEADAFARWFAKKTDREVRLPTSVEWEVAAGWSPGKKKILDYPWGDAWREVNISKLLPVGKRIADQSTMGCFDMATNVSEWTSTEPKDYLGHRVVRGGNFTLMRAGGEEYAKRQSRVALRSVPLPVFRLPHIGFRLAETPPNPQ